MKEDIIQWGLESLIAYPEWIKFWGLRESIQYLKKRAKEHSHDFSEELSETLQKFLRMFTEDGKFDAVRANDHINDYLEGQGWDDNVSKYERYNDLMDVIFDKHRRDYAVFKDVKDEDIGKDFDGLWLLEYDLDEDATVASLKPWLEEHGRVIEFRDFYIRLGYK